MMEAHHYNFIKHKVRKLMGVDLDYYKSAQMQRRLNTYLQRSGYTTWPSLFRAIQDDPVKLRKLKDYLTINVSSFFRDPKKFDTLRESVLPDLLRRHPRLRVWSAGCSRGHEPYSLAILLAEVTGFYSQHFILATDLDRSALEWARAGGPYSAGDVTNVSPLWLKRYFRVHDDGYRVIEKLRKKITFRSQNLLTDPFEGELDLIVCRNVVIYFTPEIKDQLYRRFHDALRPGGVLFVGGTEVMSKAGSQGFEMVDVSFYRRHDAK
jgi:chemotaxis protein methyltransferase CheR